MNATHRGIVLLMKSAVTGKTYDLPSDFLLEEANETIKKQGLSLMAVVGGYNCGLFTQKQMLQSYYHHLLQSERQIKKLSELFRLFDDQKIDYLPVKGCVMKDLYPKQELRSMGDADILIRVEQYPLIRQIMEDNGFSLQSDNDHVYYWKSDSLHVELHKCLVPVMDRDYYAYYHTGWHLAQKQTGNRYALSPEDHFVFMMVHFARHYRFSGIGCRHVVDLYVYRKAYPNMNESYILQELEKLKLDVFCENVLRLLDVWFEDRETDKVTEFMSDFILSGGSWGKWENYVLSTEVREAENRNAENVKYTKLRSAFRAIFPPLETMRKDYPVLKKYPLLFPGFWCVKWLEILLFRRESIVRRKKMIGIVSDEKANAYKNALQYVGLDFY